MAPKIVSKPRNYRIICCLLCMLLSLSQVAGQRYYNWRDRIDRIIEEIDSLSMKSQKIFYANNYLSDDEFVRETWHYTMKDSKVAIFEIRYFINGNEFSEIYYLDRGQLICMEKYETVYITSIDDQIKEGEICYFVSNSLVQYVSLGKEQQRTTNYDRQSNSLKQFEKRFAELQRNLAMK